MLSVHPVQTNRNRSGEYSRRQPNNVKPEGSGLFYLDQKGYMVEVGKKHGVIPNPC